MVCEGLNARSKRDAILARRRIEYRPTSGKTSFDHTREFMILSVHKEVQEQVAAAVRAHYGLAEAPPFAIEVPPNRALGDLAVTVAFQLARSLRKAPRSIAQELAGVVGAIPGVARIVAAPNGYLNLYLDRPSFLLARVRNEVAADQPPADKTIVEHTAINPNKAAHVGHLRNAALGDT